MAAWSAGGGGRARVFQIVRNIDNFVARSTSREERKRGGSYALSVRTSGEWRHIRSILT